MKKAVVDLSKVSGYIEGEEDEKIAKVLKSEKLYSPRFLYSIFNIHRTKQVMMTGNYRNPGNSEDPDDPESRNSIFAFRLSEFIWESPMSGDLTCIKTHAKQYYDPAIAVYDKNHFVKVDDYEYRFKDQKNRAKSLVGIVSLKLQ